MFCRFYVPVMTTGGSVLTKIDDLFQLLVFFLFSKKHHFDTHVTSPRWEQASAEHGRQWTALANERAFGALTDQSQRGEAAHRAESPKSMLNR